MRVVAGVRFEIEGVIDPAEGESLRWAARATAADAGRPPFRIRLERRPTAAPDDASPAPARVEWDGARLRLAHARFEAEIDPAAATAVVRREAGSAAGLVTTLRTAASARLPLHGGVLVHAAALARGGTGLVFFGPSGIGKSTLSARSPWPVLSEELVAVAPGPGPDEGWCVSGAALPASDAEAEVVNRERPLAALVELAQGPRFSLEMLDAPTALRQLLGSIAVPPAPPLWRAAVAVSAVLARSVRCYRMAWSLDEDPFEPIALALAADPPRVATEAARERAAKPLA